jgi:N-terminal domain of galactosyltransferase/Glycosyl transferase family 2
MTLLSIILLAFAAVLLTYVVIEIVHFWKRKRRPTKISLLVPFHSDGGIRQRNWDWLHEHWKVKLPDAEIIVQDNHEIPFCKTAAVNAAFKRSHGDIIVILDADCYMDYRIIQYCAARIREARRRGNPLWFIPYRRFYRLTDEGTTDLLTTPPGGPMFFTDPPKPFEYEHTNPSSSGHHWAALVQIVPREAFEQVEGMDERFKGWGGEDVSFMHAVDTIYGSRRTCNSPVYHLCHPIIEGVWKYTRQWAGQPRAEINGALTDQYVKARGDRERMLRLISKSSRSAT